jgi:hypothetical protein
MKTKAEKNEREFGSLRLLKKNYESSDTDADTL